MNSGIIHNINSNTNSTKKIPNIINNSSELTTKAITTLYEQMLLQQHQQQSIAAFRNKAFNIKPNFGYQSDREQLQPQIKGSSGSLEPTYFSNNPSSSLTSLLSISSKSPSSSPNDSTGSNEGMETINNNNKNQYQGKNQQHQQLPQMSSDYDAKYRAYMTQAAAVFPYSMFGMTNHHVGNTSGFGTAQQQNSILQNFNNRQLMLENMTGFFPNAIFQRQQQQNTLNSQIQQQQQQQRNNLKVDNEPKPAHSYIGLIALAILSTPEKRLVLSDIYQWILDNYSYFHTRGSGWRNSIRHNLSLNDCFMKSGRSSNGKGHFWIIHPANLEDFSRGDFRRRRAQRRVRRSLGLTLPEEDAEDEEESQLLTPPSSLSPVHPNKNYKSSSSASNSNNNSANSSTSSDYVQSSYKRRYDDLKIKNDDSNRRKKVCSKQEADSNDCNKLNSHENDTIGDSSENDESGENNVYNEGTDSYHYENDQKSDTNRKNNFSNHFHAMKSTASAVIETNVSKGIKRSFNVDSLLAPEAQPCESSGSRKRFKIATDQEESDVESYEDLAEMINKDVQNSHSDDETEKPVDGLKYQSCLTGESKRVKVINRSYDENINSPFSKVESQDIDVEKWKQTFSKIMARSYKNNSLSGNGIGSNCQN